MGGARFSLDVTETHGEKDNATLNSDDKRARNLAGAAGNGENGQLCSAGQSKQSEGSTS